ISPNEHRITPGCAAIARARSIISSGVTHTGQPGPWTRRTSSGNSRSMPLRTRVCVWPPQTSMIVHGRVTVRRMTRSRRSPSSGSRYSSRNFMGHLLSFPQLAQLSEQSLGLGGVDAADGDAGVDDDIVSGYGIRDATRADAPPQAVELHQRVVEPVRIAETLDDPTWNAKTHQTSPRSKPQVASATASCPTASPPSPGGTRLAWYTRRPAARSPERVFSKSSRFWKHPPPSTTGSPGWRVATADAQSAIA